VTVETSSSRSANAPRASERLQEPSAQETGDPSALAHETTRAVALRQQLHQRPELGHHEHQTAALLERELAAFEPRRIGDTGLVVQIGPSLGPQVIMRAELDGLPITERTEVGWRSRNGAMHACGHDVHMAALVAATRVLATRPLDVGAVAVFQPSEEAYPSGARTLLESGAFDGTDVGGVVGFHLHPDVDWGTVAVTAGPVNAAADEVRIDIHGSAGHAAYPHRADDVVSTLCQVVVMLQHVISRRTDPMRPTLLSVCTLQAGEAANTLPSRATATGTLRCLFDDDRPPLRAMIREAVQAVATAGGCTGEVTFVEGEPAVVNDAQLTTRLRAHIDRWGLATTDDTRSCGADDFGYLAQLGPAVMGFVGLAGHPAFVQHPLHHPAFLPPDDAVGATTRAFLAGYAAAARDDHR
jgi:amidohydrolase